MQETMRRLMTYVTEEQIAWLRQRAFDLSVSTGKQVSIAEVVRAVLDAGMKADQAE